MALIIGGKEVFRFFFWLIMTLKKRTSAAYEA